MHTYKQDASCMHDAIHRGVHAFLPTYIHICVPTNMHNARIEYFFNFKISRISGYMIMWGTAFCKVISDYIWYICCIHAYLFMYGSMYICMYICMHAGMYT